MDLTRRIKWKGWSIWKKSFWKTDWLHMVYRAVSGYGERILRTIGVLAAIWIMFVMLYTRVGFVQLLPKISNEGASSPTLWSTIVEDKVGQPLEFSRALTYSLGVMSLQKPEPKPLTGTAQTLVTLETILGPPASRPAGARYSTQVHALSRIGYTRLVLIAPSKR